MEEALALAGMDLRCIVRTWFFISDILEWYREFNSVRTEIYRARGLFDRYLPASTGIGGRNPDDAAVVATALAMQGKGDDVVVKQIPSPLQCSARDYGSSFSRAAEVSTPDFRSVFVSGTASVDKDGRTAHVGDVDAQVKLTLEIVGAILQSRGMQFADITRANAYFKHPGDARALSEYGSQFGLPAARVVVSHNDICRAELLFEIEVDAVRPDRNS
jgi:enamine deaminase RidA (YjgF/YER057c/UK114 family)